MNGHLIPALLPFFTALALYTCKLLETFQTKQNFLIATFTFSGILLAFLLSNVLLVFRKASGSKLHYLLLNSFGWIVFGVTILFRSEFLIGIEFYRVSGASMAPTLLQNHLIAVERRANYLPAIGDIVVLKTENMSDAIVKRVANMPVEFGESHDYVWVLGDNLSESTDSRLFGRIPTSAIIGEVRWRW